MSSKTDALLDTEAAAPGLRPHSALLRLAGITKARGDRSVLHEIDLRLDPGEIVALGGANGVGKTTLLTVAAGLLTPDAGDVLIQGLQPRRDRSEFQARLGYLSAGDRGLYARLTVLDHVELALRLGLVPFGLRPELRVRALARFDLDGLVDRPIDQLSMGERQRVRLALAFAREPPMLLLDEPETSLDDHGRRLLGAALLDQRARGGATLWCAPEPDTTDLPKTRIVMLLGGPH